MESKILAVDFDGVLCEDKYPKIGEPNMVNIQYFKRAKENGDKLILWTCRRGIYLNNAVAWCRKYGLEFDAVNENLPEMVKRFHGDSRKIFADVYYDDRNVENQPEYRTDGWDFVRFEDDVNIYANKIHPNVIMKLDENKGLISYTNSFRARARNIKTRTHSVTKKAEHAVCDYIDSIYPIKVPFEKDIAFPDFPYEVLCDDTHIDANIIYIAAVFKKNDYNRYTVDVNKWFYYDVVEHTLTPISDFKKRRLIRKYDRTNKNG